MSAIRRFAPDAEGDFRWQAVDTLRYKQEGSAPFKDITRQVLFAPADQATEMRYFEIAPGGFSTLERHRAHACGADLARQRHRPTRPRDAPDRHRTIWSRSIR